MWLVTNHCEWFTTGVAARTANTTTRFEQKQMKRNHAALLAAATALAAGIISAQGATSTWTGSADNLWTTGGNWTPAGPPAPGDDILFPNVSAQSVDLGFSTPSIGSLTFNAPDAYSLANGWLTLGGSFLQNGTGSVTIGADLDLGGVNRDFGGSGSGLVTLGNPVTDNALAGARAYFTGGNWVITNSANTVDRFTVGSGATVTVAGSVASVPDYPAPWYLGGNGTSGGFFGAVDGGTLQIQATQPVGGWFTALTPTVNSSIDWADRAFVYGPNGGTLVFNTAPPMSSPPVWFSQGGTSTLVVGEPLPYSGDPWAPNVGAPTDGTNQYRSPFEVEYGVALGIFQNSSYTYSGAPANYKWRTGSGDFQLILTNGASAYLDWNVMTNGNFIIRGHPGGDSSVVETNATGWTRNVGRLAIRGVHRNGAQYSTASAADAPAWAAPGVISRSFYMPQPYAIKFYDAVQVWNRNDHGRLACDISVEPGASVDVCGGRRVAGYDWGHIASTTIAGPTNLLTIQSGGRLNLNLQLRSNIGDGRTSVYGESAGLRIFSLVDIKDGGQLKIYRSQTNAIGQNASSGGGAATKCIELFRPITGNGTTAADSRLVVDLPFSPGSDSGKDGFNNSGKDGVSWTANPNAGSAGNFPGSFPIVNGTGDYGLRVVGKAAYLTNYLYAVRKYPNSLAQPDQALTGLTGAGGTLTLAVNDNDTLPINNGPVSASAVKLGLDKEGGSTPTFVLGTDASMVNFAGLVLKGGTASVDDSSTVTMQTLKLAGSATINLGTVAGGSMLSFANSSAVAWNVGTLTITSWNGSTTGGGSDQIKVGTDATGLTPAQLAQIKWIAPNGGADVTGAKILSTGEIVPADSTPPVISSPALVGGHFVFQVAGAPGQTCVVQSATNLTPPVVWANVLTNTGTFNFTNAVTLPESYFRVLGQ
jgi:hypothetical protein